MIKITLLEEEMLQVVFNYYEEYITKMRLVPGARFNQRRKCWEVPLKSFPVLEKIFKGEIVYVTPRSVISGQPEPNHHSDIVEIKNIHTALPLYDFQKFGASFLYQRAKQNGFAFLCDATGIGKTAQALGALLLLSPKRTLVVTPAAVRHQWAADAIPKFLKKADVVEVEGPQQQRLKLYGAAEITVANYEALLRDADRIPKDVRFELIILDECQKVKNHQGKTYGALKRLLRRMSPICFFLTATPMMNNLDELYALFELASPGFFGKYSAYAREYMRIDYSPGYPRLIGYRNLDQLTEKIAPYILRRTERHPEVASALPQLSVQNVYIEPSGQQKRVHAAIYSEWKKAVEEQRLCRDTAEEIEARCRGYIMLMQGAADDLRLFHMSDSKMAQKYIEICPSPAPSPKLMYLTEMVADLVPQGKVAIFTCFERMARLIADALKAYNPALFTGKNKAFRNEELKRFWHDSFCRVLVLTDAGGVGLNIQRARFLVNFDLPWSPGQLEQRYGRIKRFGGCYSSIVGINLISRDMIDERIFAALEQKQEILKTILAAAS